MTLNLSFAIVLQNLLTEPTVHYNVACTFQSIQACMPDVNLYFF